MRSLLKSGHESCEVILLFYPPLGMFENFLNYTFMFVFQFRRSVSNSKGTFYVTLIPLIRSH